MALSKKQKTLYDDDGLLNDYGRKVVRDIERAAKRVMTKWNPTLSPQGLRALQNYWSQALSLPVAMELSQRHYEKIKK